MLITVLEPCIREPNPAGPEVERIRRRRRRKSPTTRRFASVDQGISSSQSSDDIEKSNRSVNRSMLTHSNTNINPSLAPSISSGRVTVHAEDINVCLGFDDDSFNIAGSPNNAANGSMTTGARHGNSYDEFDWTSAVAADDCECGAADYDGDYDGDKEVVRRVTVRTPRGVKKSPTSTNAAIRGADLSSKLSPMPRKQTPKSFHTAAVPSSTPRKQFSASNWEPVLPLEAKDSKPTL